MNLRRSISTLLFILLAHSPSVFSAEMLVPVDRKTTKAVEGHNRRALAEELYFSKRHRFVIVDIEALLNFETTTITLLPGDAPVEIRRKSLVEEPSMGAVTWTGNVVFPDFDWSEENWPKEDLEQLRKNGMTIEQLTSQVGQVRLFIVYWDTDDQTGEAHFSHEGIGRGIGQVPIPGLSDRRISKKAFVSVSGEIDLTAIGRGVYRLAPARYSPKYHVLYQVDPDKTFSMVESGSRRSGVVSEDEQKSLAYDQFLQSLPEQATPTTRGDLQ